MAELTGFLAACWSSGMLFRSVCALVIMPTAAWLVARLLTPALARTADDPTWQAPLAAAAASIPGLLLIVLSIGAAFSGSDAACRDTLAGRVFFGAIVAIGGAALTRASWLCARRFQEARRLVRASQPATGRLAFLAKRANLTARTIDDDALFCALAGAWYPVVVISSGALARLSDDEVFAALHHERAHARRGDQFIAAALAFLVDLVPLPAQNLVSMYRHARELAADHHALHTVEAVDLAAALLRFVRPTHAIAATAAFGGDSTVHARLDLLLRASSPVRISVAKRTLLAFALGLVFVGGIAPAAIAALHPLPCSMSASLPMTARPA